MTTTEDPFAAARLALKPHKEEFILEAATKIATVYGEFQVSEVETILWNLHEQQLDDLSKVLNSVVALVSAEHSIDNTSDIYCQAEKVGKRITHGIFLRHTPEDTSKDIELARVIRWSETLKDYD